MAFDFSKENILARMELPGSSLQLAIFRIAIGLQILYSSNSKLLDLLKVVKGTTSTKTIFPTFLDNLIALIATPYLAIVVKFLSVFLIFGLFTRFILPPLFISFLLLFGFWYSKFNAPVPWLYIWFPLLVLCFARCSDIISLDSLFHWRKLEKINRQVYRWPVELVVGWYGYIYVAAGLAKIVPLTKGIDWLNGGTSQKIIHDRFLDSILFYLHGRPFFDYTQHSWFFSVLSIAALIIEMSCMLLYFTGRYNYLIISLIILMHFFLYLTGVSGFMQVALILSICLLPPDLFNRLNIPGV